MAKEIFLSFSKSGYGFGMEPIKSKRSEVDIFNRGINIRATRGGKLGRVNPPLETIDGDIYVPQGVVRWLWGLVTGPYECIEFHLGFCNP